MKNNLLIPALALFLLAPSCGDDSLKRIANALNITAKAVGEIQSIAIEANAQGLLSQGDTRTVLELAVRVNKAGKEATAITRGIAKLEPQHRSDLRKILDPIVLAVNDGLLTDVAGIKNEATRLKIKASFVAIQSAIAVVQTIIAAKG